MSDDKENGSPMPTDGVRTEPKIRNVQSSVEHLIEKNENFNRRQIPNNRPSPVPKSKGDSDKTDES